MDLDINYENDRLHAGSFFIALGVNLLFARKDPGLGIANNYEAFIVAILCNLIDFLFDKRKKFRLDPLFVLTAVLVVALDLAHMAFGAYDRGAMVSILLYLVLIISVMVDGYSFRDAGVISNGTILASGIFTFLVLFSGREMYEGAGKYVFVQQFGDHRVIEPNYMGALMTLGFCLCIYQLIGPMRVTHSIPGKAFYIVFSVIIFFGILLSGSRSALVSVLIFGMVILLLTENRRMKKGLFLMCCAGAVLLAVMVVSGAIPESTYSRLFQKTYLDESNSIRIKDWLYGIKVMMDSPLTGSGPAMTADLILEKFAYIGDAHNTFITVGIMYGAGVLMLFVFLLGRMAFRSYRKKDSVLVALMAAMVFEWNIIACQFTVSTWITILICMIMVNTDELAAVQRAGGQMPHTFLPEGVCHES